MRVCVGNLKGGAGKTTTAVLLALGLYLWLTARTARPVRVLLVDCDPEQSQALDWARQAGVAWPAGVQVLHVASRDLAGALNRHHQDRPDGDRPYDAVVYDVGPKNPGMLRQAMALCTPSTGNVGAWAPDPDTIDPGRLVIPVRPTGGDVREVPRVLALAAEVDKAAPAWSAGLVASVLLTQVRSTSRPGFGAEVEARQLLADQGIPVLPSRVRLLRRWELAFGTAPATVGELADYDEVTRDVVALGSAA